MVPFTYKIRLALLNTPARCVHPVIGVEPVTVFHDIPLYTENFAIFSGVTILFNARTNAPSFDTIVYSGEALV